MKRVKKPTTSQLAALEKDAHVRALADVLSGRSGKPVGQGDAVMCDPEILGARKINARLKKGGKP